MRKKILYIAIFVITLALFFGYNHLSSKTGKDSTSFVSFWNTANTSFGSSSEYEIQLPLVSFGEYNFIVNWGDDTESTITS